MSTENVSIPREKLEQLLRLLEEIKTIIRGEKQ